MCKARSVGAGFGLKDSLGFPPIALAMVVAAMAAEVSGHPHDLALPMMVVLSIGFSIELLVGVSAYSLEYAGMAASALPRIAPLWTALASSIALACLLDIKKVRRAAMPLGLIGFLALPLSAIRWNDRLCTGFSNAEDESHDKKYDALTGEEAFYLQPKLLEKALAGLREQHPRQAELFFVGMAGDAGQGVFLKEVRNDWTYFRQGILR